VIGVRLSGNLPQGTTATDLVLTVTELLRKRGVVGKFVEYFGPGVPSLPLANRATLGNMSPEFGSTCAIFPIDKETLNYLRLTGRSPEHLQLVESYAKTQGLWHEPGQASSEYSDVLELDLSKIEPCIAGPKRPQDRIALKTAKQPLPGMSPVWLPNVLSATVILRVLKAKAAHPSRAVSVPLLTEKHLHHRRLHRNCRHHQLHQYLEP